MIRQMVFNWLRRRVAETRPPDHIIGGFASPYMLRWWVCGRIPADAPGARVGSAVGSKWAARRPFGISVYLHCFLRSDDDRAMHDHPWPWLSWILQGGYDEITPCAPEDDDAEWGGNYDEGIKRTTRRAGSIAIRSARALHRVKLWPHETRRKYRDAAPMGVSIGEQDYPAEGQPCWTLFITWRYQRPWGFMCSKGWVPWRKFAVDVNDPENAELRGVGCGAFENDRCQNCGSIDLREIAPDTNTCGKCGVVQWAPVPEGNPQP